MNIPLPLYLKQIIVIIFVCKQTRDLFFCLPLFFLLSILLFKITISLSNVVSPNSITGERKTNTHEYEPKRVLFCLMMSSGNMPLTGMKNHQRQEYIPSRDTQKQHFSLVQIFQNARTNFVRWKLSYQVVVSICLT